VLGSLGQSSGPSLSWSFGGCSNAAGLERQRAMRSGDNRRPGIQSLRENRRAVLDLLKR
jgi:hypothetical protein